MYFSFLIHTLATCAVISMFFFNIWYHFLFLNNINNNKNVYLRK
jgi:hypothetical protein